jgi:hypothetical protein
MARLRTGRDAAPLAPDVAYLWRLLEPALAARGLLEGEPEIQGGSQSRREIGQALAFAVAMERRAAARLADLKSYDRESAEEIRTRFRGMARAMAFMLGLLPADRVDAAPVDAAGHDPEMAEWFAVDPDTFAVAVREALALAEHDPLDVDRDPEQS